MKNAILFASVVFFLAVITAMSAKKLIFYTTLPVMKIVLQTIIKIASRKSVLLANLLVSSALDPQKIIAFLAKKTFFTSKISASSPAPRGILKI